MEETSVRPLERRESYAASLFVGLCFARRPAWAVDGKGDWPWNGPRTPGLRARAQRSLTSTPSTPGPVAIRGQSRNAEELHH